MKPTKFYLPSVPKNRVKNIPLFHPKYKRNSRPVMISSPHLYNKKKVIELITG